MLVPLISFRFSFSPCFLLPSHSTWHNEKNESCKKLFTTFHIYHFPLSSPSSYSPSLFSISLSFHSPFKVLFSFRSHYLFSIGLSAMFSFSGSLPRSFTLDSQRTRLFLPLCLFAPSLWLFFFFRKKIRVSHPLCLFSPAFQQASRLLATLSGLGKSSFLFPNLRIQSFFKRALSNASPMPFFPNRIISAWAFSPFTRSYYGNRRFFLFLRLLRCFNSPGILEKWREVCLLVIC